MRLPVFKAPPLGEARANMSGLRQKLEANMLGAVNDEIIFYDGNCGLCHRFVQFVLPRDPNGHFRFAPLQSATFTDRVSAEVRATLPDSVVVTTADGRVLIRSAAVRHVMRQLGGVWRVLAVLSGLYPRFVLDLMYDQIAASRHKLFAKPVDACPVIPQELRARFI